MTIRRAVRGLIVLAIFLVTTFVAVPPGRAQGSVPVTLRLVSQTPWNTLKDPVLDIAVQADNARRVADRRPDARRHHRRGRPVTDGVRGVARVGARAAGLRRHGSRERPARAWWDAPVPDVRGPVDGRRDQQERLARSTRCGSIFAAVARRSPWWIRRVIFLVRGPEVPLLVSTTIELTATDRVRAGRGAGRSRPSRHPLPRRDRSARRSPRSPGSRADSRSVRSTWSSNRRCSMNSPGWRTDTSARTAAGSAR